MKKTNTNTSRNPALLPKRHQPDFFVCDIFDATPKGDSVSMEHPIFSLSSKPDRRVRRYEHGDSYIEVKPSSDGLATVLDRDIIIFCISQIMAAKNKGNLVSQVIRFQAHDLLVATNRDTSGRGYEGLKAALERLRGTSISTNLSTGGTEQFKTFGLIDSAEIIREVRDGRMREIEVKLSDWVFNAINEKEVLTLSPDYFRLRKTLERRIYEIARKHCGNQASWKVSIDLLRKKTGSKSASWEFKRMLSNIIKENEKSNYFPDYIPTFVEKPKEGRGEVFVLFKNRKYLPNPELTEEKGEVEPKNKSKEKSFEDVLKDVGIEGREVEFMLNYISLGTLQDSVNAASIYIEKQKNLKKAIESPIAIYRTAIKEQWSISRHSKGLESEYPVDTTLDQSYEDSIEDLVWKEVRKQFVQEQGVASFNSWIKELHYSLSEGAADQVILQAKSKFCAEWVKNNYITHLERIWKGVNSKVGKVTVGIKA